MLKKPVYALIDGVVRGMLQSGIMVKKGMNRDIDPRDDEKNYIVSDKGFI